MVSSDYRHSIIISESIGGLEKSNVLLEEIHPICIYVRDQADTLNSCRVTGNAASARGLLYMDTVVGSLRPRSDRVLRTRFESLASANTLVINFRLGCLDFGACSP
jgi:hypothetical protein